jgi:hypothetical protein
MNSDRVLCLIAGIFFVLFAILLIIHPVSAAKNGISLTVSCTNGASLLVHNQESGASGSDLNQLKDQSYTGWSAGHRVLTNYGAVNYALDSVADASEANTLKHSSYAQSNAMMITDDTVSMEDSAPNQTDISCTAGDIGTAKSGALAGNVANKQWTDITQSSMGQGMEVQASKHVNDANVTLSGKAAWNGTGDFRGSQSVGVEIGATQNSTTPNLKYNNNNRFRITTNESSVNNVSVDQYFEDYTNAFVTKNATECSEATAMYEEIVNGTLSDEDTNSSEEV